jgi:hypothetical protein
MVSELSFAFDFDEKKFGTEADDEEGVIIF